MARTVQLELESSLHLKNIRGFLQRRVTKFGTGAKVDCPKEYLGKNVYLVIVDDSQQSRK